MIRLSRLHALLVLALWPPAACLPETPQLGKTDGSVPSSPLRVTVVDGAGTAVDFAAIPRRPRIRIEGSLGEPDDLPLLVRGASDARLTDDAARAPWSTETLSRSVACSVSHLGDALVLTPRAPLEPGGTYTLVLAGFARDASGRPFGEPRTYTLVVAASAAGAVLSGSFPSHGSVGVPTTLARFDVAFDDAVSGLGSLSLIDESGAEIPTLVEEVPCAELGFGAGSCASVVPLEPLAARRRHLLELGDAVRDRFGDLPIDASSGAPSFTTADEAVAVAPTHQPLPCATDEQSVLGFCALTQDTRLVLRARFSAPVRVSARYATHATVVLDRFGDVRIELLGLEPASVDQLTLRITALDGAEEHRATMLSTYPTLPWVVLAETRADAIGPEPASEYVELWNPTDQAIDVGGYRISDDETRLGDLLPAPLLLHAGARLLIVSDDFDPTSGADARPPSGTTLARIGASIGSSGLSNGGEPLFLRDPEGRRVAEMPAVAAPGPGVCIARLVPPSRDSPSGGYGPAEHRACTPGTP